MNKIPRIEKIEWDGVESWSDFICRQMPCDQFAVEIEGMTYSILRQLQVDLETRIENMKGQLDLHVNPDEYWLRKINSAIEKTNAKARLVRQRIELSRMNAVRSKNFADGEDHRLDVIRGLLHFFDNRQDTIKIPDSMLPLIDFARQITDSALESQKFNKRYVYDHVKSVVQDTNGVSIAKITAPGSLHQEIGHMFERSIDLLDGQEEAIELCKEIKGVLSCPKEKHSEESCLKCRIESFIKKTSSVIDSIR